MQVIKTAFVLSLTTIVLSPLILLALPSTTASPICLGNGTMVEGTEKIVRVNCTGVGGADDVARKGSDPVLNSGDLQNHLRNTEILALGTILAAMYL